jgi:hypothetical protein
MAEHRHYVEHTDSGTGVATGMVLAIVGILLIGILALFLFFGGPGRFVGGTTAPPSNTNVNVPAPAQSQPQTGPQINVPPRVDINVQNPSQGTQNQNPGQGNGAQNQNPAPSNPGGNR